MTDTQTAFAAHADLDSGVAVLATDAWIQLMVFFNSAVTDVPSTEARMRTTLGMQAQDEFTPEIRTAMEHFGTLKTLGEEFLSETKGEILGLADDIFHYETAASVCYDRLVRLIDLYDLGLDSPTETQAKLDQLVKEWTSGSPDETAQNIRTRVRDLVARLAEEARTYAERSVRVHDALAGPGGHYERLAALARDFAADGQQMKERYGEQSTDVTNLKKEIEKLQAQLRTLRRKESDEVIVLSSSPVYLVIPVFGPIILAGVDIGVGVDLAHVRADIEATNRKAQELNKRLGLAQRFVGYYDLGQQQVEKMAKGVQEILPKIETIGLAWRAVAADLDSVVSSLAGDGASQIEGEDWNNLVATLEIAKRTWHQVAQRADAFRSTAQPEVATSAMDLLTKANVA